ncbi:MAG TPA: glucosidase, partial [Polyangiaceae bacterium]|nr:glucosidase [Polyangiaceae bacterium]
SNKQQLFGQPNASPYVKDGIDRYVVHRRPEAVNPSATGTKASAHHALQVRPGESVVLKLRLSNHGPDVEQEPFADFDRMFALRQREAEAFYRALTPPKASADEASVMRQALAGMLWTKQYYHFEVDKWLAEHGVDPYGPPGPALRNRDWAHMVNGHVISMPDKWEYPWYAAWDLAFHAVALASVDVDFAKGQLDLMLRENYLHPNGQMPAYEWNFGDVNPPVHSWATLFLHRMEEALYGEADLEFLKRSFNKLVANFTWWVNRKDRFGKNLFEGGFLGLDNIGVFDRSAPLPTGGYLEQADGTAWMALYCQNMLELAVEIAAYDRAYEDLSAKFVDHFFLIANALNRLGPCGMWDEEDGFYYDVLRLPDGSATRLRVRSMVGLLPLFATTVVEPWQRERVPRLLRYAQERMQRMPHLLSAIHPTGDGHRGHGDRGILALVGPERLRRILARMLDEREFLSPYGIRSLSRAHLEQPYSYWVHGEEFRVSYVPAESDSGMFGGNSNWRGPVWMPVNVLIVRALLQFYQYYGDSFRIECPTGSGRTMNLFGVAREIAARLTKLFLRDEAGRRPIYGGTERFQRDPNFRDHILFFEYFHGDNGAGLGASHQTGWTGLVASLIRLFGRLDEQSGLELGARSAFRNA